MKISLLLLSLSLISAEPGWARVSGNRRAYEPTSISNFAEAKKYLKKHLDLYEYKTIYCGCTVVGSTKFSIDINSCGYKAQKDHKRALRLEWEHVVPAEAFGQSFVEWRIGSSSCIKHGKQQRGRKCAETNPEFAKMESDLYNLFPEDGELNGLRSNYSMAALTGSDRDFAGCKVKLSDRKFEPSDAAKGIVARTYLNFENRYPGHGVVSDKNRKLFEAWDKQWPVSALECRRWTKLESINGYPHLFKERCK